MAINTTNTSNRTTSYFYNDFGEVVKVNSPVTGVTTYQYNASGLIIGQQRQDGSRSLYTRDAAQRVVEIKSLNAQQQIDEHGKVICAELAGDFHLGYARQLTDKSSLLFDLAF